jgi:6-phosphogluconolactonase
LRTYSWDPREARLQLLQAVSTYPVDYSGQTRSGGEIALSRDGRFLYVSLRGDQDSLVVYEVGPKDGQLREIQRLPALGKSPWCMAIDPGGHWLFVTNEASNSVNLFNIDRDSGRLRATPVSLSIPRPVAVTFYTRKQH